MKFILSFFLICFLSKKCQSAMSTKYNLIVLRYIVCISLQKFDSENVGILSHTIFLINISKHVFP